MLQNRQLLLFALFLCFMLNAKAQQTYEKTLDLHFDKDYRLTDVIEKENGNYLITGYSFNGQDYKTARGFLIELSPEGDSIRGIFLPVQHISWQINSKILSWTGNKTVILSVYDTVVYSPGKTCDFQADITCVDDTLGVISSNSLNFCPVYSFTNISADINDAGDIIISGDQSINGMHNQMFLYHCNVNGDSIQYKTYRQDLYNEFTASESFVQFTGDTAKPYLSLCAIQSYIDFVYFNSQMDIAEIHSIEYPSIYGTFGWCVSYPSTVKYAKGKWFLQGTSCSQSHYFGQQITITADSAFNYLNNQYWGLSQYLNNYPAFSGSLDLRDTSVVYFGCTSNLTHPGSEADTVPTWIMLTRANSNIQPAWTRFYGGDANYVTWKIIATRGGGCIAFTSRYDYLSSDPHQLIYLLKVNADGYVTDTTRSAASGGDAIVHTSGNSINIISNVGFASPSCFDLKNEKGNIVIEKRVEQPNMQIDVSNLPAGNYKYTFYTVERSQEGTIYIKQLPDKQKQFINNEN